MLQTCGYMGTKLFPSTFPELPVLDAVNVVLDWRPTQLRWKGLGAEDAQETKCID